MCWRVYKQLGKEEGSPVRRLDYKVWGHMQVDVEVLPPFQNNDLIKISFLMPRVLAHGYSPGTREAETADCCKFTAAWGGPVSEAKEHNKESEWLVCHLATYWGRSSRYYVSG